MRFDYNSLKTAEYNGMKIGNWNGKPVFACSMLRIGEVGSGAYYILYDDDNKIVGYKNNRLYVYGTVSTSGNVDELRVPQRYDYGATEEVHAVCGKSASECNGTAAVAADTEAVVGDVKLGIDVDATLKAAREMTIDSLLEGFNYGLDVAKG